MNQKKCSFYCNLTMYELTETFHSNIKFSPENNFKFRDWYGSSIWESKIHVFVKFVHNSPIMDSTITSKIWCK